MDNGLTNQIADMLIEWGANHFSELHGDSESRYFTMDATRFAQLIITMVRESHGAQPIESAPKDGTLIKLGFEDGRWDIPCAWGKPVSGTHRPAWCCFADTEIDQVWCEILGDHPPTHWMPLSQREAEEWSDFVDAIKQ